MENENGHHEDALSQRDKVARAFNKIDKTDFSTLGFGITFAEEKNFSIYCNTYENHLNYQDRKMRALAEITSSCEGVLKKLKDIYKKDTGKTLKVKVLAENSDCEMISLNSKYKLTYKRLYQIED